MAPNPSHPAQERRGFSGRLRGRRAKRPRKDAKKIKVDRRSARSSRRRGWPTQGEHCAAPRHPEESGLNPDKVEVTQFSTDQINEMCATPPSMRHDGRSARQHDHLGRDHCTARARGEPTFLPIDVSEAIASPPPGL